jgi:tetratricopeptide (TPR) repeat protein
MTSPQAEREPTISLAMIVRNEEANLPACLESAAGWVDEIVVVDTGSTDRTPEIAASFGARVYHHPWQRHFSLHRNQSLGYCTGDWIFILDGDEELMAGSGEALRQAARQARSDTVTVVIHSVYDSGRGQGANATPWRMFRNDGRMRFRGRVHNELVGSRGTEPWPIHIHHKGYNLDEAGTAAKFERTATLLQEQIAEDGSRPRPHHYLAAAYLSQHRYGDAVREAAEAIRLAREQGNDDDLYLWSHFIAALACLESGRHPEAEEFCRAALRLRPRHFDSHFLLARLALERHDWAGVFAHTDRYLELVERFQREPAPFGQIVFNTAGYQWHAWHHRAVALSETGRQAEAEADFQRALSEAPDQGYCLRLRGSYYGYARRWEEARECLGRSLELCPGDPEVLLGLAATWHGQGRTQEEAQALRRLLAVSFEPKAALRLASLGLAAGELNEARALLERVLEAEPDNLNAVLSLGLCLRALDLPAEAVTLLEGACARHADSAEVRAALAQALLAAGDPRAKEALGRAVELTAGLGGSELRLRLARLCLVEGDVEGLLAQCEALLRSLGLPTDRDLEGAADLAALLVPVGERLLEERLPEAAAEALGLAVDLDPGLSRGVAGIFASRGLWREALTHLEAALGQEPCGGTLLEMAAAYEGLGQAEAAELCRFEAARLPQDSVGQDSVGTEGEMVV